MNSFFENNALQINFKRIEHLKTLDLDFKGKTVFETGCGAQGDLSTFLINNGAILTINDAKIENINRIKKRIGDIDFVCSDLNKNDSITKMYDIIFCYGTLYHLDNPVIAIKTMAEHCKEFLIICTIVNIIEKNDDIYFIHENVQNYNQSFTGKGCRPSREWVYNELKKYFKYIFIPITQPNHEEFPLDWTKKYNTNTRAIFIATNDLSLINIIKFTTFLTDKQLSI